MRMGTGIVDNAVVSRMRLVELIDECSFVVRLKAIDGNAPSARSTEGGCSPETPLHLDRNNNLPQPATHRHGRVYHEESYAPLRMQGGA